MNYTEKIYNVEKEARKFICDLLDKHGLIKLLNKWEDHNYDMDELYELPSQLYIGKYEDAYTYYITEVYKDEEDGYYYASGIETENNGTYEFNLYENTDSMTITEIADFLNKKFNGT